MTIKYSNVFVKMYDKLEQTLQVEVKEKILLFREKSNHKVLEVHKLHGKLKNQCSFSVNYKYRIVFEYSDKNTAILLAVDDHDTYK